MPQGVPTHQKNKGKNIRNGDLIFAEFYHFHFIIYLFLLLCWMGGILAFTKLLKMYQVYHT
jgi:hypothetical protein